ncbi:type 2 isopentenyl-diphosphate Delta-isomerase [Lentilactobacillus farraginis]|uniref:Isopentenyl-diphosphate delta-isomerase n=1 Tax=Lentilactobacillus farraginis DSM 18382 = JCM 14108 TaxID=1423743 RepID=X0PF44_9LACO|nr:type 2 isopentenyl-diphosphate Delta-isomerase [Lentilactobacillus farraginis]KRM07490.1 isopentenyl pyrophosphate isomerase [Lentilactobacillus farraginis DSM 18382 = JCM 14108]GAF35427.1 isopentenyl-diphosphate delta-isomerase [Lentilactobacillus farraginis DSM 18382 = JCM 14108]
MISKHSHRKDEHLSLAEKFYRQTGAFDGLRFVHQSVPKYNLADIDLTTAIGPLTMKLPFYIEAISGGSPKTAQINQKLAMIAKQTGLAMAVGSQSVALSDPTLAPSFKIVRQVNPNGLIFANIGANQSLTAAQQAIEMIGADALEVHVNPTQELIMPEGDRQFQFLENISQMTAQLSVPVIVKEVGFGMSRETIQQLIDLGVAYINVSGHGGTNFAEIENFRRRDKAMDYLKDWGLTTPESLLESRSFQDRLTVLASGGVKSPLDIAKCLALGAKAVGIAGEFLHLAIHQDIETIIQTVQQWQYGLKTIMMMTNSQNLLELRQRKLILSTDLLAYLNQRHLTY